MAKRRFLFTRRRALRALALAALTPLLAARTKTAAAAQHVADGMFRNNYIGAINKPISDLLRWRREAPDYPVLSFPLAKNDPAFLHANRSQNTVTWIGHATLLFQLDGLNLLTDPHFSERASPVSFTGPKRGTPPGLALADLPPIDAVLISHNHYDHLDYTTINQLLRRDRAMRFFVPLGVGDWLRRLGATQIEELNWGEERTIGETQIIAEPCQHWSSRTPWDRNRTLWVSWVVQSPRFRLLFIGDTGYSQDFADLGTRYGDFDLAAIPIGAYAPRWFMKDAHINPQESVAILRDLRAKQAVATHWGTFQLTDEKMDEPPQKLRAALHSAALAEDAFMVLQHGETRLLTASG